MAAPKYRSLVPLFEELRGDLVLVRSYRPEDAPRLFEAVAESRDHLRLWMPWADSHQTVEESLDWINHVRADWTTRTNMTCGIFDAADPSRYLGGTGLHPRDWSVPSFAIGYWIRPTAAGRGYVTEAVNLLTAFALDVLGAKRVEILCDERNTPSANVARRAGYVLEGVRRNDALDTAGNVASTKFFSRVPGDAD
jgi:RimJ/RimL family protein N-acetyltransferase